MMLYENWERPPSLSPILRIKGLPFSSSLFIKRSLQPDQTRQHHQSTFCQLQQSSPRLSPHLRVTMHFSRVASFFLVFLGVGMFTLANPVAVADIYKRQTDAAVTSVLDTLKGTLEPVLAEISQFLFAPENLTFSSLMMLLTQFRCRRSKR